MRAFSLFLLALSAGTASLTFADNSMTPSNVWDGEKLHQAGDVPFDGGFVGGEDIANAYPITELPFFDTGNTCGFAGDYDVMCPYGGYAPDVVYSFAPVTDMEISIDLCDSWYDTKLTVYEDNSSNLHACNNDGCGGPNYPWEYLSFIDCVHVSAGHRYYIVVGGYVNQCGDYELHVSQCEPCIIDPPPGAQVEDEPICYDDYIDHSNGGCGSFPPVFDTLACSGDPLFVHGTTGTYLLGGSDYRDTDWFEFTLSEPSYLLVNLHGCFPSLLLAIQALPDCYHYDTVYSASGGSQDDATLEGLFAAGRWWIWVGPSVFSGVECGSEYLLRVEGLCPATSAESASWGSVKTLFR